MKLNKKEQALLIKPKEYKPIASPLARKARWSRSNVIELKTRYKRKQKHNKMEEY